MLLNQLFKFELWPLDQVGYFERDGEKMLDWYCLTDGWYTIDCGGTELLRYSQRVMTAAPQFGWKTPYFDYMVARLHEDILELIPDAIDPVPSDVLDLVRTREDERVFMERCNRWCEKHWHPQRDWSSEETRKFNENSTLWKHAAGWWLDDRRLSRGHLHAQPGIHIWSESDTLLIRWTNDCGNHAESGMPWTDVEDGQLEMSVADFLGEVRSFHNRLINSMRDRVEAVRSSWRKPNVAIDIEKLVQSQADRTLDLDRCLNNARSHRRDWNLVRQGVQDVIRLVGQ